MKTKMFSCLIVAAAVAGMTVNRPAVDLRDEPGQIDFVSLHDQANSAMRTLQLSQESRLAIKTVAAAEF